MNKKKVGFIYLDELHHIHHFLSPAVELSKKEGYQVEILTYQNKHQYLQGLIDQLGGYNLKITRLNTYLYRKVIETIKKRKQPSALYIYQKHIKKLINYDALIFTDHTLQVVYKARAGEKYPQFIHLAHGSGDRAYGYQNTHKLFDLIIGAGKKKTLRLKEELANENLNIKICGYSKFDLLNLTSSFVKFNNNNPVVLYNPHFERELSSWHKWGIQILDYFLNQPNYNLIFAPHINLFNKKGFGDSNSIGRKYYDAPNIHIDLGSTNSIDMTYNKSSDIYLGDVSSQVYEFMVKIRPLIFLNAHNINWNDNPNHLFWKAGKVIDFTELSKTLETANSWCKKFEPVQKQLFEETFNLTKEKSGSRVANAILQELI